MRVSAFCRCATLLDIELGHPNVKQHDLGLKLLAELQRLHAIVGRPDLMTFHRQ
jgi:hypothetical protein